MKIAKSSVYSYEGWRDGYHILRNDEFDTIELVKQAKFIDVSTDVVIMLLDNGKVEPSHSSSRRCTKQTCYEVIRKMMEVTPEFEILDA